MAGLLVFQDAASAAPSCSGSSHCYDIAVLGPVASPHAFTGVVSSIRVECLSDTNSGYINDETWLANSSADTWIEAGVDRYESGSGKVFFWADQRPGSYNNHYDTTDTVDTTDFYNFNIYSDSSTTFHVTDGDWDGESTGWPSGYLFDTLETGTETFNGATGVSELGNSKGLEFYNQV
jgi:hypothetical protein